jgi:methyl-accepting chemotaxis protein
MVLIVTYLGIGFYLAVRRTVNQLDLAAQGMVSGNMTAAVNLDTRDELGRVVAAFNKVATELEATSA